MAEIEWAGLENAEVKRSLWHRSGEDSLERNERRSGSAC